MSITPLKIIDHAAMHPIALGGAFLGTGGGGDPYIGRLLAEQAIAEHGPVAVVDVAELADDALIVPVAMMGAPTVMLEKLPRGDEAQSALRALEAYLGKPADAIFCVEAGGLNSTIPVAVAATCGLPIVDGDAMGRAFPELQMVSMAGLIALYPMTGAQAKQATLRKSISLIHSIGSLITSEQSANRNPADRLATDLSGVRLFEGRVMDVDRRTEGGFARGTCLLHGLGPDEGNTLVLEFQNEFLLARTESGEPRAITPDLICLLDLEIGEPITTEQIRYGFRVIVFGLPCDPQWRSEKGLELVGPGDFGYDVSYQTIESLNAS